MRKVCLVAFVGMMVPGLAGAQGLGPRTVVPMHVPCAALPIAETPAVPLSVAASERGDGRLILSLGEMAVIHAGTDQGLQRGQSFLAQHVDRGRSQLQRQLGRLHRRAVRRRRLPRRPACHRVLTIERINERFSLARVVKACDQVEVGDYLAPLTVPAAARPGRGGGARLRRSRDGAVRPRPARDVRRRRHLLIDRGSSHGVTPGMRFALFHTPESGGCLVAGCHHVLCRSASVARPWSWTWPRTRRARWWCACASTFRLAIRRFASCRDRCGSSEPLHDLALVGRGVSLRRAARASAMSRRSARVSIAWLKRR